MLERYSDILIIGQEIPGLIAGAFLARRGLVVRVLDTSSAKGNIKKTDPFCVAHLNSKLLRSILGRLGMSESESLSRSPDETSLQIIFPKKRLDISPDPSVFYAELDREFPNVSEKLKVFYEELSRFKHQIDLQKMYSLIFPRSYFERRRFRKFVKEQGLDKKLSEMQIPLDSESCLKEFILSQMNLVMRTMVGAPFAFQAAEILNPNEGDVLSISGGHEKLQKIFLDYIDQHKGAAYNSGVIEKLEWKGRFFERAIEGKNSEALVSRYLIWNTDVESLIPHIPSRFRFRGFRRKLQNFKPKGYWFTVQYEVPTAFLSSYLKENILVITEPEKPLWGKNYLYIQVKRKPQTSSLSVHYLLDQSALNQEPEKFSSIHEEIRKILHHLIPFADNKLVCQFPLEKPVSPPDTLFPLDGNDFDVFKKSAATHPVYEVKAPTFPDLFPISFETPSKNLFLTSPEVLGTLGYEGKYLLGLKITDLIWGEVEKMRAKRK